MSGYLAFVNINNEEINKLKPQNSQITYVCYKLQLNTFGQTPPPPILKLRKTIT